MAVWILPFQFAIRAHYKPDVVRYIPYIVVVNYCAAYDSDSESVVFELVYLKLVDPFAKIEHDA